MWPRLPGSEIFRGVQIHSSQYRYAEEFRGARVVVVGAGNSGAQILSEVSQPGIAAQTMWSTEGTPSFLPKTLTGKDIFDTGDSRSLLLTSYLVCSVPPCSVLSCWRVICAGGYSASLPLGGGDVCVVS